ncbi:MAG: hypothetical protein JXR19_10505 [Bacteroidia bacterium]
MRLFLFVNLLIPISAIAQSDSSLGSHAIRIGFETSFIQPETRLKNNSQFFNKRIIFTKFTPSAFVGIRTNFSNQNRFHGDFDLSISGYRAEFSSYNLDTSVVPEPLLINNNEFFLNAVILGQRIHVAYKLRPWISLGLTAIATERVHYKIENEKTEQAELFGVYNGSTNGLDGFNWFSIGLGPQVNFRFQSKWNVKILLAYGLVDQFEFLPYTVHLNQLHLGVNYQLFEF